MRRYRCVSPEPRARRRGITIGGAPRMPAYIHTLVPHRVDFVPPPDHVALFLSKLISIGAAPLKPTISVSKLTGEVRRVTSGFTGMTRSLSLRRSEVLENVAAVTGALNGLDDYNVTVTGEGPPQVPALVFDFE